MTPIVLPAGLLMAAPSLWAAFTGRGSVDTALLHLALGLLVSAVAGSVLRTLVRGYQAQAALAEEEGAEPGEHLGDRPGQRPGRRRTDA